MITHWIIQIVKDLTTRTTHVTVEEVTIRSNEEGMSSNRSIITPWTAQIVKEQTIHLIVKQVIIMAMISTIMRVTIKVINHEVITAAVSTVA